jgi:hypothetical protein
MKKIIMLAATVALSSSMFAGCGSGCFNSCEQQGNACNRPGSCGVQGVPPDVREYRANPNVGVYSTGEGQGVPAAGGQNLKQGGWQNNNPKARNQEADRQLYNELSNALRGQNLSITVNGGVVTLQGRVASEQEKKAIGDKVNAMPRVKRLNNQLEVWNATQNPLNTPQK